MGPSNSRAAACSAIALLIAALGPGVRAQNRPRTANIGRGHDVIYFLAARPTGLNGLRSYAASLYTATDNHRLHRVRRFFGAGQHFSDYANDLHGTIYLAGEKGIYVIHSDDPQNAAFVPVSQFDDAYCWSAVDGPGTPAGVQYCPSRRVNLVPARPSAKQPRDGPGSWAAFKSLQFRGENGSLYQAGPPAAEIVGAKLEMPYGATPKAVLAQLPERDYANVALRRRVSILASTDRYLVIWIEPPGMGGTAGVAAAAGTPLPYAAPVPVLVLNKRTHRWQSLRLPTTVSRRTRVPVRLFGNWLVTTVRVWSPPVAGTGSASLGVANEQKTPMYSSSSSGVHAAYDRRFLNVQIPGKLAVWNLADGRRLMLNTGQPDSEVLSIGKNGDMLYRVNDAIYSAKIDGDSLGSAALVVKSPAAADIHWVLCGGREDARSARK